MIRSPDIPVIATMRRVKPFLLKYKGRAALAGGAMAIGILLQLPLPFVTKYIIDSLIRPERTRELGILCLALVGVLLVRSLMSLTETYWLSRYRLRVVFDLKRLLYEGLLQKSLNYAHRKQTGYLISRISGDVEGVQALFAETILQVLRNGLTFLVGGVVIYYLNVKLALIATCLLPLYTYSLFAFNRRVRQLVQENREAYADVHRYLQEHISGLQLIKTFVVEQHDTLRMLRILGQALRAEFKAGMTGAVASLSAGIISSIGPILLLWLGILEILAGRLTLGGLIAFNSFLVYLFSPLSNISSINVAVQNSIVCAQRVFAFLDEADERAILGIGGSESRAARIEDGNIHFQNVTFQYPNASEPALDDVSFYAPAGQVTALVGFSGAGKTSVANLLFRFYDHQSGTITVDGVDIRILDLPSLRRQIGLVTQEAFLFGYSIAENIKLGNPQASDADMQRAAEAAYAADFISRLPEGYATRIGERGATISGGERQRIALARVFLKNPRLVILDEATSSLDNMSEQYVRRAIDRLFEGRTVIVITHRLQSVNNANQIVVLNHGRVEAAGTHADLLCDSEVYRQLCLQQSNPTNEVAPTRGVS